MAAQEAMAAMLTQSFGPLLEALRDAVSSSAASVASASAMHANLQHGPLTSAALGNMVVELTRGLLCS